MVVLTSSEEVLPKWCAHNLDQKFIKSNSQGSQQFDKVQQDDKQHMHKVFNEFIIWPW